MKLEERTFGTPCLYISLIEIKNLIKKKQLYLA